MTPPPMVGMRETVERLKAAAEQQVLRMHRYYGGSDYWFAAGQVNAYAEVLKHLASTEDGGE